MGPSSLDVISLKTGRVMTFMAFFTIVRNIALTFVWDVLDFISRKRMTLFTISKTVKIG